MPATDFRILCACGFSPQARGVAAGIEAYRRKHDLPWRLVSVLEKELQAELLQRAGRWHGVAGFIKNAQLCAAARARGLVVVSCAAGQSPVRVLACDQQIVDRAIEHCRWAGFTGLAIIPNLRGSWQPRYLLCWQRCAQLGFVCQVIQRPEPSELPRGQASDEQALAEQLRRLPRGTAVFCSQDRTAANLRALCERFNLRVPDELGIIGVDDDERLCCMQEPTLSSVVVPWPTIGVRVARELHRRLQHPGLSEPDEEIRLPVFRVHARASTGRLPHPDSLVDTALRWIEEHYRTPRASAELSKVLGVHAATLCRRLRQATGSTAQGHLARCRLDEACRLLDSGVSQTEAARRCGFQSRQGLRNLFLTQTGVSPAAYAAAVGHAFVARSAHAATPSAHEHQHRSRL